jgi:DNA-binding XRE family transcriptional regulator
MPATHIDRVLQRQLLEASLKESFDEAHQDHGFFVNVRLPGLICYPSQYFCHPIGFSLRAMSIHRLIKEGRLSLGLSEREFADAVGVSRGAVQQWEKPGGTAPRRSSQHRVAQVLGISVSR